MWPALSWEAMDRMTDAQITALLLPHGHRPGVVLCHGGPDHTMLAWLVDGALCVQWLDVGAQRLAHLGFAALA